jgi:hypothetical protein
MYMNISSKLEKITIGADPELFVATLDGEIASAIGNVGGSKDSPRPVPNGAVQEDNVLAEFNINPASSKLEFIQNITSVMGSLHEILALNALQTVTIPSYVFAKEKLEAYGWQAMEFGCTPEHSAWTDKVMKRPNGETTNLRTAGGHIHIGYEDPNKQDSLALIQMLDFTLGLPSLEYDADTQRRKLYGKAGSMRFKPYGVEYRPLSNFWLNSNELMGWAYDTTFWTTQNLNKLPEYLKAVSKKTITNIINKSDVKSAKAVMAELGIEALV